MSGGAPERSLPHGACPLPSQSSLTNESRGNGPSLPREPGKPSISLSQPFKMMIGLAFVLSESVRGVEII